MGTKQGTGTSERGRKEDTQQKQLLFFLAQWLGVLTASAKELGQVWFPTPKSGGQQTPTTQLQGYLTPLASMDT